MASQSGAAKIYLRGPVMSPPFTLLDKREVSYECPNPAHRIQTRLTFLSIAKANLIGRLNVPRADPGRQMEGKGMAEAVKAVDQARGKAVRLVSDLQRKLESRGASGPFLSKLEDNAADDLCMGSPVLAEALKKVVPHLLIRSMLLYRGWWSVPFSHSGHCLSV
jgi:hypothetical protein